MRENPGKPLNAVPLYFLLGGLLPGVSPIKLRTLPRTTILEEVKLERIAHRGKAKENLVNHWQHKNDARSNYCRETLGKHRFFT